MADPLPDPPPTEPVTNMQRHALTDGLNELNANLCRAVGVDPEAHQGFRLTVLGGQLPQLETYTIPPISGPGLGIEYDPWSSPLGDAVLPTTAVLLPGNADGTQVQVPPEVLPADLVPDTAALDHMAARVVPMLADVVNGAACPTELRDWLTTVAHQLGYRFQERVYEASEPNARAAAARTRALIDEATAQTPNTPENPTS